MSRRPSADRATVKDMARNPLQFSARHRKERTKHPAMLKYPYYLHQFPRENTLAHAPQNRKKSTCVSIFHAHIPRSTVNQHKSWTKIAPGRRFHRLPGEGTGLALSRFFYIILPFKSSLIYSLSPLSSILHLVYITISSPPTLQLSSHLPNLSTDLSTDLSTTIHHLTVNG